MHKIRVEIQNFVKKETGLNIFSSSKSLFKCQKQIFMTSSVCPAEKWSVNLEEGIDQEVAEELRKRGHEVNWPIEGTLFK